MKRAIIVIALIIVLCSISASAIPFRLAVGKSGYVHLDSWGTGKLGISKTFDFDFDFSNNVYVYNADVSAHKTAYRCGGVWKASLFEDGKLVSEGEDMGVCRGFEPHCYKTSNLYLEQANRAVVSLIDFGKNSRNRDKCDFHIYGTVNFIDGERIQSTITSKSGIVNFGKISDVLGSFVFTESQLNDFVVKSDNQRVMVWTGTDVPETPLNTKTQDNEKQIWACYDGDLNGKCDYNEDTDCLADYGDFYKGVCCGPNSEVNECKYVSYSNDKPVEAFCAQLENGEWAWIAKENKGEIFSLDPSYCPASSLVVDGTKFFSTSKSFAYYNEKDTGMVPPPACKEGYVEIDYVEIAKNLNFPLNDEKIRVCERKTPLTNASINVPTRYGTHEYIKSAGNLFECAADFPFSTNNYANLGENTLDLSGRVCPESAIIYYPLENSADNELNQFVNGVANSISFTTGKIGNAALFSSPTSDIEIAPDQINLNLDEFSFSAWINPSNTQGKHIIFNSELSIELYLEDNTLKASLYTEDNSNGVFLSPTNMIPANQWSYVVLTYNGNKLRLFVDGSEISYTDASGKINAGTESFIIGARSFAPNEPFEGLIDEVVVYSRALRENEIQNYASLLTSYCYLSNFTELFYCASDGDWTKDLDIKDSNSCHAAGFDWTGSKCCSEADDPGESYSDFSTPAVPIDMLITEKNNADKTSDYDYLLEQEDSFVTVKGPSRILTKKSYWRAEREDIVSCTDKEDVLTSFDLIATESRRIVNKFNPQETPCTISKTTVISLPILAAGGCFDKTFYPSGSLLDDNIINYQGQFTACKNVPSQYQSYDFIDLQNAHCGVPLINIIRDIHAVCLPGGAWAFIDDSNITVVDDTLWDPITLNVPNAHKQGCCSVAKCWNGTGCQLINTFYRVNDHGFICK